MGKENINPNLGTIAKPLPNGAMVVMVKSQPGIYYDASGDLVPDEMALEAGFNVASDRKEKAKREAIDQARQEIEERFKGELSKIEKGVKTPEEIEAAAQDNGEPFIEKNSQGDATRARLVRGGPIRERIYDNQSRTWSVVEVESGKTLVELLDKKASIEAMLLE